MTRDEEILFAAKHGIPVEATKESPYSIRSESHRGPKAAKPGVLEDPWDEPLLAEAFAWTTPPRQRAQ